MKIDSEQKEALGRGGRPTLTELLDHLVFRPVDAQISLAGARMVLQRASVGAHLRDLLQQRHGAHEAMVTLMRIGYRAGLEDAEFVRTAWPNIDVGDAFTAGTRLHMLSGVVKVETLSNDFDFERGRYASEFLWHGSVEAIEHQRRHGRSLAPVCWLQTGYAAGYASQFFRRLVVYKEIRCAAMGHRTCHISGGTAAHWGDGDPMVRLFREEIVPSVADSFSRISPSASTPRRMPELDPAFQLAVVLAQPVASTLERIVAADLPAIIGGPEGSGRLQVAHHLMERLRAGGTAVPDSGETHHVACIAPQALAVALQSPEALDSSRPWLLESIELLDPDLQRRLAAALTPIKGKRRPMIVATAEGQLEDLVQSGRLRADLAFGLGVMPVELPLLSGRADRVEIAHAMLIQVSRDRAMPCPALSEDHRKTLVSIPLSGQLPQLRALMTAAVLDPASLNRLGAETNPPVRSGLDKAINRALSDGPIDLDALSQQACRLALAKHEGNVAAAARSLGLTRPQLAYRLRRH